MDPTANLKEQLELAKSFANGKEHDTDDAARLAELVLALHQWMVRGGALPAQWYSAPRNKRS